MILVPSLEPTNITIEDKIQYAFNNPEQYNQLTGADHTSAYINFIMPGFTDDKPDLNINLISPNLINPDMVQPFYDKELRLYINYMASFDEMKERINMYEHDLIIKQKLISPSWNIVVYIPLHSIDSVNNQSKFNLEYGLSLVGTEVNLINIQKYYEQGIKQFNLHYLDLPTTFSYIEAKKTLLKEFGTKFPEAHFLICAKDARLLELPENFKVVVSSAFWNPLFQ